MADEEKKAIGEVDEDVKKDIEERVQIATTNESEFSRLEVNFYCELLSQMRSFNKELDNLYQVLNIAGQDKIMAYFKELSDNFRKEEIKASCHKSHKRSKK